MMGAGGILFQYILFSATTVSLLILLIHIFKIKKKGQMQYIFIPFISLLIIWNIGAGLERWFYFRELNYTVFQWTRYTGIFFIPVIVFLLGLIFTKTRINLTKKYCLLFIIPVLSFILLVTNDYHHLFCVKYSLFIKDVTYGKYFAIHASYSYLLILIGISMFIYSSIRNSGFLSRQLIFIVSGFAVPLLSNVLVTLKIIEANHDLTPITFSFTAFCLYIAIFKYDFLGVFPIALQIIVDRISNGFIVIDMDLRVVNFNKTMLDLFSHIADFKRKESILKLCDNIESVDKNKLKEYIKAIHDSGKHMDFEKRITANGKVEGVFTVELTPIIHKNNHLGTLIMFTDITQHKKDLDTIRYQQQQITEKERLASLGTLMGGISHNLKTPIMSITGCVTALQDLRNEYRESIGNPIVDNNDHLNIATEMKTNINDIKNHMSYISNALTAIKNQVVSPDSKDNSKFSLEDLINNIEFLMRYEINTNKCSLDIINEVGKDYLISGDIGTLVQILNNLISNSIQSYDKVSDANTFDITGMDPLGRKIILHISRVKNGILFMVKDYGKGISQQIKDKLFKEMVTSKGKEGHGIGLYLCYSKVKLMFKGDMWLESDEGKGTSFFVKILDTSY